MIQAFLIRILTPIMLPVMAALMLTNVATAGWAWWRGIEIEHIQAKQAKDHETALKAAIKDRDEAIKQRSELASRAAALAANLAVIEQTLEDQTRDLRAKLKTATTGRLCLGADAVRLLNTGTSANTPTSPQAPPSRTGPATDAGPTPSNPDQPPQAAPDGPVATDTDVANWAATAQQMYATCAARLSTWQAWWDGLPTVLR
jgi:hypothetical protein